MHISKAQMSSIHTAYNINRAKESHSAENQTPRIQSNGDSVTISSIGRMAAYAEKNATMISDAQENSGILTGVEQYQLPSWLGDMSFSLPSTVAEFGPDGKPAGGSIETWFKQRYPEAAATSASERNAYLDLVHKHYKELLEDNGIFGTGAHYKSMIVDKDFSESMRQQMVERIKNDTGLMNLAARMGKTHLLE